MNKPPKLAAKAALIIGAVGVVFGDIGTSPLYAMSAIFGGSGLKLPVNETNVYGILSLIIWSVTLVVSVKYLGFIMRTDNKSEGGIMALVALLQHGRSKTAIGLPVGVLVTLGLVGVALFYGDSVITPAISVLSAVEGLESISSDLGTLVLPLTLLLLTLLFWLQKYGTGVIGRLFGPIMIVWFITIGAAGVWEVFQSPAVLQALSPLSVWWFIKMNPLTAFLAFGAVVLAITGAEALYADMGHFGRAPIARAWFLLVFPALIFNYMGQAAVILSGEFSGSSPFMALFAPEWRFSVILLATAATLIASQSVIAGTFSLTRQAVSLGFLPQLRVLHTSALRAGQVYLPFVNMLMFAAVALLVVGFGSSARLANAYGIAVSGTLAIDTLLFLAVASTTWRKGYARLMMFAIIFTTIDLLFLAANLNKLGSGGWIPIALSAVALLIILTWIRGQAIIRRERQLREGSLQDFVDTIPHVRPPIVRVPGCAVYIGHHPGSTPLALQVAVYQLHELHQKVAIVYVNISNQAHVPHSHRVSFDNLERTDGISCLVLNYGYHDTPHVPLALQSVRELSPELDFDAREASYFISLSRVVAGRRRTMAGWRKSLYCLMSANQLSSSDYYHLPIERTIEQRALLEL